MGPQMTRSAFLRDRGWTRSVTAAKRHNQMIAVLPMADSSYRQFWEERLLLCGGALTSLASAHMGPRRKLWGGRVNRGRPGCFARASPRVRMQSESSAKRVVVRACTS